MSPDDSEMTRGGPSTNDGQPILVIGVPRSGTTWTHGVLRHGARVFGMSEPDNEQWRAAARHAKRDVGRFPVLAPGDDDKRYRQFWEWIFRGAPMSRRDLIMWRILSEDRYKRLYNGSFDPIPWLGWSLDTAPRWHRRHSRRVMVKSVHAQFALDWLTSLFDIDVLVVSRHPAEILASWIEVDLQEGESLISAPLESRDEVQKRYLDRWGVPQPGPDRVERMCWRIGLLQAALEEQAGRHPEWHHRTHEQLCSDPEREFRHLYQELGLAWTQRTDWYLEEKNTPGTGFVAKRVASELPGAWRQRLDGGQVDVLRKTLALFPIASWTDADFDGDADVDP
jgi:hypothetical protein